MKRLGAIIILLLLAGCCAVPHKAVPAVPGTPPTPPEPEVVEPQFVPSAPAGKHTFAIFHYRGFGHGCAVNGIAITNRHMVDPRTEQTFYVPPGPIVFRFQFLNGPAGQGRSIALSKAADLARVVLSQDPENYATLAVRGPAVGETLMWVEYDFRTQAEAFAARYRTSQVARSVAGHIILTDDPTPGASGGCAYNAAGEVVGLITFGMRTEDTKSAGGITALWGAWWADVVEQPGE